MSIKRSNSQKTTVRELRRFLFENNLSTYQWGELRTNKESRDYLYSLEDQEQELEIIVSIQIIEIF